LKLKGTFFWQEVKITKLDLLTFKDSLFSLSHSLTLINSVLIIFSRLARFLSEQNKLESSAKRWMSKTYGRV
jgi:hypothetical protein